MVNFEVVKDNEVPIDKGYSTNNRRNFQEVNMLHDGGEKGISFDVSNTGAYLNWLYYGDVNFLVPFFKKGDKYRGRSHLCLPFFGKPREHSALHGKVRGHGEFRRTQIELQRREWGIHCPFNLVPGEKDAYVWPLQGFVQYRANENELRTEVQVWRDTDGVKGPAPINIADHPYWRNWKRIIVEMNGFSKTIDGPIPKAMLIPYAGPVSVYLNRSVKVELEIEGNQLIDPQLVLWSDGCHYTCVELAMTHPGMFHSANGAYLEQENGPINVVFTKRLFIEGYF